VSLTGARSLGAARYADLLTATVCPSHAARSESGMGFPLAGAIGGAVGPGLAVAIAGACGIAATLSLWPRG
jgi:hypothetical protein